MHIGTTWVYYSDDVLKAYNTLPCQKKHCIRILPNSKYNCNEILKM